MKYSHKLAELAKQELPYLVSNLIIKDDQGFDVFGRYRIQQQNDEYVVTNSANEFGRFSSTRTALAWCIADKYKDINLAIRIKQLDTIKMRYNNDIVVRSRISDRISSGTQWETVVSKVNQRREQARIVDKELSKCVERAKYYQIRGFSNETN